MMQKMKKASTNVFEEKKLFHINGLISLFAIRKIKHDLDRITNLNLADLVCLDRLRICCNNNFLSGSFKNFSYYRVSLYSYRDYYKPKDF